ncbi:uncharacterized protein LOC135808671 [Sycon ciliatum]|uniref:uncharacterized protein LOC135808671 n=1 Tax=Sycon ciliatum TaxID=27933 RepID=UPI0031F6CA3F
MAVPGREASAANGTAPTESPTESLPNGYDPWDELVSGKFPIISQIIDDASQLHDAAEQCFYKQINKDERSVLTWLNSLKAACFEDDMEPGKTHSYDSQLDDCHMFVMLLRVLARNKDLEMHKAKRIEAIARDVDDNLRLHQSNTHSSTTGTTLYRWIHARSFGNPATAEASPENSVLIVDDRSQIRLEQTFSPLKQSLMHAHEAHQAELTPGDRAGQASATAVPPCIVALCGDVPGMLNGMQQMQTSMSGSAAARNETAAQQHRKLIADAQGGGVYALHQHASQGLPQPRNMDEPSTPSDLVLLAVSLCASDDPDNASPCSSERNSDGCAEIDSRTQDQDAFVHERNCCSMRSALEAANTLICFFSKKQTENMMQEEMQAKWNAETLRDKHTHQREGRRPPVEEAVPSTPPVKPSDCFYPLQLLHDCLERFPKNGPFVNSTSPLNLYCVFDVSQQFFEKSNVKEVMQLWIDNLFTSESDEVMSYPDRSTSKSSKNTSSSANSSASSTPSTHVHVAIKPTCSFQTLSTFQETCPQLLSRAPPVDSYWVHSASGIVSETVNPVRSTGAGLHGTAHVGMTDATEWLRTAKTGQYAQRTRSGKIRFNGPCLQTVFPHCSSGLTRLERLLRAWHGNVRVLTCTGIGSASQKALTLLNEMGCMAFATNTACSASAQAERIADGPEGMCPECSIHVGYRVMADHSTLLLFFAVCRTTPTGASTPSSPHECPALVVAHKLAHVTVITCDEADRSSAQEIEPAVKDLMEHMCMGRGMEAAFPAGHLLLVSEPSKDAGKLPGGMPLNSGRAHLDQLQDYATAYSMHFNDDAAQYYLDANTSQQRNEADAEAAAEATEDTNDLSPSQSRQPAPEAGFAVLTKGEMMKWLLTPRRDRQPGKATWRHGAEFLNCLRLLLFKRGSMVECADHLCLSAALCEQYESLLNDLDTLITTGGRLQLGATSDGIAMPLAGHYQPAACIPFKFENHAWHKQDLPKRDLEQLRRLATELLKSSATVDEFKRNISQEHRKQVNARRKLGKDWLEMWAFERVGNHSRKFRQCAKKRLDLLSNGEKLCLKDIRQDGSDNFSMPCLLPDGHDHQVCDILIGRKNGRHPLCNQPCTLCTEDGDGDFCRKPIGHHLHQIIGEEGRRHLCSSCEKRRCKAMCTVLGRCYNAPCVGQASSSKGQLSASSSQHQSDCSYRKQCSNKIPPDGKVCNKHSCGKPKEEHYCTTPCPLCNEPCNKRYGHAPPCKVKQHGKVNQPQGVWNEHGRRVFTIPANTVDCKGGHLQRLRSDSGSILPRPRRNTEPARNLTARPDLPRSTHESPPAVREGIQLVDLSAPAPQPTTAVAGVSSSADTVSEDALPDEQLFEFDSLARGCHQSNSAPDSALSDQQA